MTPSSRDLERRALPWVALVTFLITLSVLELAERAPVPRPAEPPLAARALWVVVPAS